MRTIGLILLALFNRAPVAVAQAVPALDIGGVELRIGQTMNSALEALRPIYEVDYQEQARLWLVLKRNANSSDSPRLIGTFVADNGRVVRVDKRIAPPRGDLRSGYTTASKELHRRAGRNCETTPIWYNDNMIWEIQTVCGRYTLQLHLSAGEGLATSFNLTVKE